MAPSRPSRLAVIRAYILLPHATPIMAVMTATALFAVVARGGWPGGSDMALLLVAMFGGQIAIGAVNELVDVDLDRVSKPSKPLVSGLATASGARVMVGAGMALMVLGSLRFSLPAFALCALGTGIGIAYSFWFKRRPWSWIPYVLAIPLLPIWVWTALDRVPGALLSLYPIAVPAIIALQVAQSVPDIEGDRTAGVRTLAAVLEERRAVRGAWGLVVVSALLAAMLAPRVLAHPGPVMVAGVVAVGLLAAHALVWRANASLGRMGMFPLVAGAVGVLGLGWALGMAR